MTIIEQLLRDEGLKLKPYLDSVGKLTIGVGRNLDDVGISVDEAHVLLANDIAHAANMLEQALPWAMNLDPARQGALLNMCFNMGIGGLLQFKKALEAMQAGDFNAAVREFEDSKWYAQVGSRAYRLCTQIASGEWQ